MKKHGDPAYGRECREPPNPPQNCGISLRQPFRSTGGCQGGARLFRGALYDRSLRKIGPPIANSLRPKAVPEGTRTPRLAPLASYPPPSFPSFPSVQSRSAPQRPASQPPAPKPIGVSSVLSVVLSPLFFFIRNSPFVTLHSSLVTLIGGVRRATLLYPLSLHIRGTALLFAGFSFSSVLRQGNPWFFPVASPPSCR